MGFSGPRRVVIVGAGLGGTATAIRLLQFAREPLQVVVIERRPEYRSAGVAYHRTGNHWNHVFNIQAGRMSMFREDVDDFVSWANNEADRTGWPAEWSDFTFTESGPAPRRIYADYLATRLADAAREASDGVTLLEADGEVVDIALDTGPRARITIENCSPPQITCADGSERVVLQADHVVLATGLEERNLPFAADVADHPAFVRHPYSEEGIERILGLRQDAVVAIIGTLLSAYDSASLLLRRGHTGTIHMISRSGLTLRTYPPDHRHRVINLPPPRLLPDGYEGRDEFVRRFKDEWERACVTLAREHPGMPLAVVTERVAKSWEPHLPDVLARVPTSDLCALLDGYGSLLATLRVGAVGHITEFVDAAMADGGQLSLITGRIDKIVGTASGTLELSVSGSEPTRTIEADLVISNFGREPNYERAGSALWTNLLRKKIAARHRRTGRGVEVDVHGRLLGPSGARSAPISVVGGPREGDEIVRYGRMGAFAFNLAAIKNHSVGVAATVLHRLESCYDERAGDATVSMAGAEGREAFDRSVMLDVHRMAARRRDDREAMTARLEKSLEAVRGAMSGSGEAPASERALRFAVNRAAMTKLNDLSVTPRDLRNRLGLDEPEPTPPTPRRPLESPERQDLPEPPGPPGLG
ncbi:pyridine nucleotide-disulfide oxidoreductase [Actinomadura sp. KC06]|uniref:FAD/NAD(P)-binding protein n=1 Tax=Actinomadura sp. KC06 TaxID=2530369 RepID=UPI001044C847|nr:FAD/NAD(P)-binding protein [Actinomadura sp. KC06]TDD24426.1 pyridine nucleotide-disulfide oxidoreductase [Actinomadura sp. KC06]